MTPGRMLRPVLVCLAGFVTASCGMVEGDPHRFESLARSVADIPLDGAPARDRAKPLPVVHTAAETGLRPAMVDSKAPLRVQIMDPHDLWDARDGGLRGAIERETSQMAEAAAPAVARAMVRQVSDRIAPRAEPEPMRPAIHQTAAQADRTIIQLGAYSSEAAARTAWARVSKGAASQALKDLSPMFEAVQVDGRALTRLKVAAPAATAAAICRAAQVNDPWCARRA